MASGAHHKYNGIYRAVETVMEREASPPQPKKTPRLTPTGMAFCGECDVIKANSSIEGQVTTTAGLATPSGHELIAPAMPRRGQATRCRSDHFGHTNMPDFAASDTNRSSSTAAQATPTTCAFRLAGRRGNRNRRHLQHGCARQWHRHGNSIRMPRPLRRHRGLPTRAWSPSPESRHSTAARYTAHRRNVTDTAIALSVMAGETA